jgi:hypothetical protein
MFAPAIGDLNGDGNPDLVIPAFSNGDVIPSGAYVLLGEANGTFLPALCSRWEYCSARYC